MVAFKKDIFRVIKSNKIRFITLVLIITVGICFVTGVGGISNKVKNSFNEYYEKQNVSDIIIKSKTESGITSSDLDKLNNIDNISYTTLTQIDLNDENERFYIYDFSSSVNKIELIDGRYPSQVNEIVVEKSNKTSSLKIDDTYTLYNIEFKVVGIVSNPLLVSKGGELNQLSKTYLDNIIYISKDYNPLSMLPVTDIYIHIDNNSSYFNNSYKTKRSEITSKLDKLYDSNNYSILTLDDNLSYAFLDNICSKIDVIALLFPLFFILVVALVTLTNMTRLIDEERKSIGCLKSLGYSNSKIEFKYISFAFACSLLGTVLGLLSGVFIIPNIVYGAFGGVFYIPSMTSKVSYLIGVITSIGMILITILVTSYVSRKSTKEIPANLFRAKTVNSGKKILLEKSKLFNKLSFKHKATLRNMFRYKSRFFMIVIAISLSTLLVMAGLGLYDVAGTDIIIEGFKIDSNDTIKVISVAIIIFALLLSILVLYNLTTLTIGERVREIATLKVLGYTLKEVRGFIYREIFATSIIGVIIGIPLGVLFLNLVFNMMNFASLESVKVSSYFLCFGISIIFIVIVFILTQNKITKVNMNDSLKSID